MQVYKTELEHWQFLLSPLLIGPKVAGHDLSPSVLSCDTESVRVGWAVGNVEKTRSERASSTPPQGNAWEDACPLFLHY